MASNEDEDHGLDDVDFDDYEDDDPDQWRKMRDETWLQFDVEQHHQHLQVFDRTAAADVIHYTSILPAATEVWVRVSDLESGGRPMAALITGEDIVMSLDWTDGHAATNEFVFAEPGGNGHWETGVTI